MHALVSLFVASAPLVLAGCGPAPADTDGSGTGTTGADATGDTGASGPTDGSGASSGAGATATTGPTGDLPPSACPGGVVPGDVLLAKQAEVEALAGVCEIEGSLTIVNDVTSLAPLFALQRIGGTLEIGNPEGFDPPGLTTLAGLESLAEVGGDVRIYSLGGLVDLDPLAGLVAAGGLGIGGLPQLQSIAALAGLTELPGGLSVSECPALPDLVGLDHVTSVGSLWLSELGVTDFGALQGLVTVAKPDDAVSWVVIRGNPNIHSLAGLDNVAWHANLDVEIYDNPVLTDIGALAGATELHNLGLITNTSLADLSGVEALAVVHEELELVANNSLTSLAAFASLESVGRLTIEHTQQPLASLAGLDALATIGALRVASTNLVDLGPLPALTQVDAVLVQDSTALTAASGLSAITSMTSLEIDNNDALVTLSDLAALVQIDERLDIRLNDALTAVDGLAALTTVGVSLHIVVNAALPQVDAELWSAGLIVGGPIKVAGNLGAPPPGDTCPWEQDGECDEFLGLCLDGTDADDCFAPGS